MIGNPRAGGGKRPVGIHGQRVPESSKAIIRVMEPVHAMKIEVVFIDVGETRVDETRDDYLGVSLYTFHASLMSVIEWGEHHRRVFDRNESRWRFRGVPPGRNRPPARHTCRGISEPDARGAAQPGPGPPRAAWQLLAPFPKPPNPLSPKPPPSQPLPAQPPNPVADFVTTWAGYDNKNRPP